MTCNNTTCKACNPNLEPLRHIVLWGIAIALMGALMALINWDIWGNKEAYQIAQVLGLTGVLMVVGVLAFYLMPNALYKAVLAGGMATLWAVGIKSDMAKSHTVIADVFNPVSQVTISVMGTIALGALMLAIASTVINRIPAPDFSKSA